MMSSARILIVDDDVLVITYLMEILADLGHDIVGTAHSSHSAHQQVAEMKPNLIFMDISLKNGDDGIELTKALYRDYQIPIVFITGHSDENTWKRAMEVDHYGYLLKPFSELEIKAALERALLKFEENQKEHMAVESGHKG